MSIKLKEKLAAFSVSNLLLSLEEKNIPPPKKKNHLLKIKVEIELFSEWIDFQRCLDSHTTHFYVCIIKENQILKVT